MCASFNTMRIGAIESFINWIESKVLNDHWSFDAAVEYVKHNDLSRRCIPKGLLINIVS